MRHHLVHPETVKKAGEIALKQLDYAGYHLNQLNITDKVNRHNCIAFLVTEDQRLRGELSRLQLKVALQKSRARRARETMGELVEQVAMYTPPSVEKQLLHLKNKLCS